MLVEGATGRAAFDEEEGGDGNLLTINKDDQI